MYNNFRVYGTMLLAVMGKLYANMRMFILPIHYFTARVGNIVAYLIRHVNKIRIDIDQYWSYKGRALLRFALDPANLTLMAI